MNIILLGAAIFICTSITSFFLRKKNPELSNTVSFGGFLAFITSFAVVGLMYQIKVLVGD